MDPVDLIIASLNVKGSFLNPSWLLLQAVQKRLVLPFYKFTSKYIRTRKYMVRTRGGLTPFLERGSGVPQGGAEGPFLYLLLTVPLALTIEQDYPAYAPYPLLSTLVTVAHIPHEPHTPADGPESPSRPTTSWTGPSHTSPTTISLSSLPSKWP